MKLIICDFCDQDLSEDKGADNYRLKLTCEKLPAASGTRCDIYIIPHIEDMADRHFCGFDCLLNWAKKNNKIDNRKHKNNLD